MATILIIDDQLTSRQILQQLVSTLERNLIVEAFANPVEALEWKVKNTVDLVLVDYKMPEMNGIEFI
ncbi:MAG: response regulator, partial [Zetaproteobacteria bacterium]|nr:response regulator [Zetaproteobacteria bacterium]